MSKTKKESVSLDWGETKNHESDLNLDKDGVQTLKAQFENWVQRSSKIDAATLAWAQGLGYHDRSEAADAILSMVSSTASSTFQAKGNCGALPGSGDIVDVDYPGKKDGAPLGGATVPGVAVRADWVPSDKTLKGCLCTPYGAEINEPGAFLRRLFEIKWYLTFSLPGGFSYMLLAQVTEITVTAPKKCCCPDGLEELVPVVPEPKKKEEHHKSGGEHADLG